MRTRWLAVAICAVFVIGCGDDISGTDDADGDGISNEDEGFASDTNTDGDEFPDWLDLDSDGDGIADSIEAGDSDLSTAPVDTDGDGTPDYLDLDADGDSIADVDELADDFTVVDTDADGTFDFQDLDSDGDGIPDSVEAGDVNPATPPLDTDSDGTPDYRDLDSDNDCIPDQIEAGANPATPTHSDSDGRPDYRDLDSDGDGLPDSAEDANCDGVLDPNESSPTSTDTDNDGTPDLVEEVAGSDPNDPTDNIPDGDFYFVLPFMGPGASGALDFATNIQQADIFFSVDTTGSFQQEIAAIQAALSGTIIPGVGAVIPNAAFGVGRFEDFPLPEQNFGLAGDLPYELLQPITESEASVTQGLMNLGTAAGGLDVPESGYEALYQWATGAGVPAFGYPAFAPAGIGGVGFRTDSLPIIIHITDAISHDDVDYPASVGAHSRDDAVTALNTLGVRVIGVNSLENGGTANDPRSQLEDLAISTNTTIPPDGSNNCTTGVGGAVQAPVDIGGGTLGCPLVFDVAPDGTGLGTLIVDAIVQLATFGTLDISTTQVGQNMGLRGEVLPVGTTTADFIVSVTPVGPPPAGSSIDGLVFRNVTAGSTVTFDVDAFNDFVPATSEDQLFALDINVLGDAVTLLDVRRVFIIVPRTAVPVD